MNKTVLITGASSGIGYELACLFAAEGYDCVLVARTADKLNELATSLHEKHNVKALVIARDLAQLDAADAIYADVRAASVNVDVLVNNAGFGVFGLFAETDPKAELQMLQVNVIALTQLTKLFLAGMLERRQGRILNVASTAAFAVGPLMAVYYASKAYVLSLSEALANELQGTGVTVTALCPGPTRTGLQQRGATGESRLFRRRVADARTVALAGYRGLMAGRTVVIPGLGNKLIPFVVRVSPRGVMARVVRQMQERVTH